ncbi:MAG TPA: G5 domain-containing protein [Lapillicoccus sp.]|nr:G5 domain-containing protein [Lapillicoccus sp.]
MAGPRLGKAGAREFTLVTASAGIATLGLALLFGAAVQTSPGAEPATPSPVAVATARSTATTSPPSPSASTTFTPTATTEPEATTTVTEVVAIPFTRQTVEDGALAKGTTLVRVAGREGSKTVTWVVRTRAGVEVGRTLSGETVTRQPVTEVTAVGTKAPAPTAASAPTPVSTTTAAGSGTCDPNYSGACVPIARDVDCAGGSGDGPAYVRGPVKVVGTDIYRLDADNDGIACE